MALNLYDKVKQSQSEKKVEEIQDIETEEKTWLIFTAGETTYAIESVYVKEILRNNEIFPLPFVPQYIKGLLNCYGEPYAIVDFAYFLESKPQKNSLFMILNDENNISLQITDIVEFQNLAVNDIQKLSSTQETSFFSGAIIYNNENIPVINMEGIITRIKADIESI